MPRLKGRAKLRSGPRSTAIPSACGISIAAIPAPARRLRPSRRHGRRDEYLSISGLALVEAGKGVHPIRPGPQQAGGGHLPGRAIDCRRPGARVFQNADTNSAGSRSRDGRGPRRFSRPPQPRRARRQSQTCRHASAGPSRRLGGREKRRGLVRPRDREPAEFVFGILKDARARASAINCAPRQMPPPACCGPGRIG